MITDSNHACFAKMATCEFQEEVIGLFTSYTSFVLRIKKRRAEKPHYTWFLDRQVPRKPRFAGRVKGHTI